MRLGEVGGVDGRVVLASVVLALLALPATGLGQPTVSASGHLVVRGDGHVDATLRFFVTYEFYQNVREELRFWGNGTHLSFAFARHALYRFNTTGRGGGVVEASGGAIRVTYSGDFKSGETWARYGGEARVDVRDGSFEVSVEADSNSPELRAKLLATAKQALYSWAQALGASYEPSDTRVRLSGRVPDRYAPELTTSILGILPVPQVFSVPADAYAASLVNFARKSGRLNVSYSFEQDLGERDEEMSGEVAGPLDEIYAPVGFAAGLFGVLPLEALGYLRGINGTMRYGPASSAMAMAIEYSASFAFNATRYGNHTVLWGSWQALPRASYTFECKGVYCLSDSGEFAATGYILPDNSPMIIISPSPGSPKREGGQTGGSPPGEYSSSGGLWIVAVPAVTSVVAAAAILAAWRLRAGRRR